MASQQLCCPSEEGGVVEGMGSVVMVLSSGLGCQRPCSSGPHGRAQRGTKYPWLQAASPMWQGAAILSLILSSDHYSSRGCDSSPLSLHALPALKSEGHGYCSGLVTLKRLSLLLQSAPPTP